ncbi:collagen-like triple helix repeat-containing protein [Paenibacillus sp. SAF-054]|uniref:collagen-like triple helix repeat-containing protein n=1 Tax=unclassified Paenibacillus TaxID=185978 RepID=UPI003F7D2455
MYSTKNYKEPGGERWVIQGVLALEGEGKITMNGKELVLNGEGAGPEGPAGLSAYELAVKHGYDGTEEEWLLSLMGKAGEAGPKGEKGEAGAKGATGAKGEPGFPTEEEWNALLSRVAALEAAQGGGK